MLRAVDRERLRRIARRHFGVFTRGHAQECGFTPYQIRRRLADGEWQVVLGRSLAFAELPITPRVRDRAAQLSSPGSILGGASAARVWRIDTPDQFRRDRVRQNRLVAAGWTVVRFTWRDLTERPDYVIATVAAVLDPRRPTERAV